MVSPKPGPHHVPVAPERAEAFGQGIKFGFRWLTFYRHGWKQVGSERAFGQEIAAHFAALIGALFAALFAAHFLGENPSA
jgi:hypothetical protein